MPELIVRMFGHEAGRLEHDVTTGLLAFRYSPEWIERDYPPLSQALALRAGAYEHRACHSFFGGLLPEGHVRAITAERLGVSTDNDFALLEALGEDCAGAVTLIAPERAGRAVGDSVRWLSEAELEQAIDDLPSHPLLADPEAGVRLSLAGAQDKIAVILDGARIGLPLDGQPSTHILKTPIADLEATVINEGFCLRLAALAGLDVATAMIRRVGSHEVLLVERYDREQRDGSTVRLHQEDLCQALGLPPSMKYEREHQAGIPDCIDVLRRACTAPVLDVNRFVDAVIFNLLVGNHDGHTKNFSLLYTPTAVRLAPLYDLLCTAAYGRLHKRVAMKIGTEYVPHRVGRTDFAKLAERSDLNPAQLIARARALCETLPDAADELRATFGSEGSDSGLVRTIVGIVNERCVTLHRNLGRRSV